MAEIPGVPISFFFDNLPLDASALTPAARASRERMEQPETIELIRLYYAIPDENVRQQFLAMAKAIAKARRAQH